MEQFPAFYYHATEKPKIVRSELDLATLGPGWEDSPAKALNAHKAEPDNGQTSAGEEVVDGEGAAPQPKRRGPGRPRKEA